MRSNRGEKKEKKRKDGIVGEKEIIHLSRERLWERETMLQP